MKHLNNPDNRIGNTSKIQPDYPPSPMQTEPFFVMLLIIIGITGAAYTFNIGFKSSLSNNHSQITKNVALSVLDGPISNVPTQATALSKTAKKTHLRISGEKEANQKIKFTIDSFDKKAEYDLFMGDGEVLHPNSKTIEYTYHEPGNYHIQLKVNFNGRSEKIYSGDIQILESIAVAPDAHQEY